jgi:caa(3)-type oxidase subunit IV
MHSDPAEIKKSIRTYGIVGGLLFIFTGITVAVNQVHLSSVALAITVALIIATMKGSMVASIFMHLNHEKKWIYGALILTAVFFVVLMLLPNLSVADSIGRPSVYVTAAEHAAQKAEKAEK